MLNRLRPHIVVALITALVALSGLHLWLRDELLDARFRLLSRPATGTVALVAIDPRSIDAIGTWPWSRTVHAELIDRLTQAGAAEIAVDVDFSSPSSPDADAALAAALKRAGGSVILPAFRQRAGEGTYASNLHVNRPLPIFASEAWLGLVNVAPDRDGIIRQYPFGSQIDGAFVPSIGALLAGRHAPDRHPFRIDFGIDAKGIQVVSAIDVLRQDKAALAVIANRKIIIAGTAAELGDRFIVPNAQLIAGALVQALAAETLLQNRALALPAPAALVAGLACLIGLLCLLWGRFRVGQRLALVAGLAVLVEAGAIIIQMHAPISVDTTLVLTALLAYAVLAVIAEVDLRGLLQMIAERRFELVAMSLGDGLVCVDHDERIVMCNPAAARMFACDRKAVIGMPFRQLLAEADQSDRTPFRLADLMPEVLQRPGGLVIETLGRRGDGEKFDLECSLSSWDAASGRQYGVVLRDITERSREQRQIRYLAEHDVVTGLANRNVLIQALAQRLTEGGEATLILGGIEHFHRISDVHGHSFSDAVLVAMAGQLNALAPEARLIARVDSDQFALLIEAGTGDAATLSARLVEAFSTNPVVLADRSCRVSFAAGFAPMGSATLAEEWLGNAHLALSAARGRTGDGTSAFVTTMRKTLEDRVALEAELRLALARGEFELFYQPQFDLHTRLIMGAEALIRWKHAERGYVSPGEFMPVLNATALSEPVADWVLDSACRQGAYWQSLNQRIRIGVNLSQSQFATGRLVEKVSDALRRTGLSPDLLELEVTEDIVLDHLHEVVPTLRALRALGVRIAFDDFGTGYGSLSHLRKFPLDVIKIDQSFVQTLKPGDQNAAIVAATIALGRALGLAVIAEGIESEDTATILMMMGCIEGQGYHFARPMPAANLTAMLTDDRTRHSCRLVA